MRGCKSDLVLHIISVHTKQVFEVSINSCNEMLLCLNVKLVTSKWSTVFICIPILVFFKVITGENKTKYIDQTYPVVITQLGAKSCDSPFLCSNSSFVKMKNKDGEQIECK